MAISYDAIGNPTSDGTWTYTWTNGRQLASVSKSGTTASYTYNEDGLRVQKNVNGTVTSYVLHGKNVAHLTQGSNNLHFFYGADGSPAIVEYNGVSYGYVKNLQGDIIAIVNASSTKVVEYAYDAWGRPLNKSGSMASTLGTLNPFRYRGYVYDEETGLYYLRSRYYNPVWDRFINADTILKGNIFTYCINSPVFMFDADGRECVECRIIQDPFYGVTYGDGLRHVLQKNQNERITVSQFLDYIKQMVDEKWEYSPQSDDGIRYGRVDCVGVYRYTMYYYYQDKTFMELNMNKTNVTGMFTTGVYNKDYRNAKGKGKIQQDTEFTVGMGLFRMTKQDNKLHGEHVAIYVGDYFEGYTNAVIEAVSEGVIIRSLDESEEANGPFTHYGFFKGITY